MKRWTMTTPRCGVRIRCMDGRIHSASEFDAPTLECTRVGLAYSFGPYPTDPNGVHSTTWKLVYKAVDDIARQYSPRQVSGLIGANLAFNEFEADGRQQFARSGLSTR
jgi:hypothetical protein